MKKLLFVFSLFSVCYCNAQNYQCIQSGVKHYFINNNNYLRGISIDSIKTLGSTVLYYPYKTFRNYFPYSSGGAGGDTAGSWLGANILQLADGTFLFDDAWGDTVCIKTLANIGNTWLFYNDTINNTYIATLTSVDTMTVLGVIDSVKKITINSYHGGLINITDPVNNFEIILSKNNGFAEIFDLYNFPYYSPSGTASTDIYYKYVGINNSAFNIVSYHNPTSMEMYNLSVGDMFAGSYGSYSYCTGNSQTYLHYDSVIYKTIIDSFHVNYAIHHVINGSATYSTPTGYYIYPYIGNYIDTLHTDTSIIFLKHMPEECPVSRIAYHFYPADTTFCYSSPAYKSTVPQQWIFEGSPFEADFKQKFLPTYDSIIGYCELPCQPSCIGYSYLQSDTMYYALINGVSCDSIILPPLAVNKIISSSTINMFPIPAQNELTITSTNKILNVAIANILGQTVYTHSYNSEQVQIDVTNLPPGMYLVRINNSEVRKFVKL